MTRLTNLRFADDVLLVAKTLPQLTSMLEQLAQEAKQCGLELHPEKTKILSNVTNKTGRNAKRQVDVDAMKIAILPYEESTKYLGRMVSFNKPDETEVENRIQAAWRAFVACIRSPSISSKRPTQRQHVPQLPQCGAN